jgi:hypothetical protein
MFSLSTWTLTVMDDHPSQGDHLSLAKTKKTLLKCSHPTTKGPNFDLKALELDYLTRKAWNANSW